MLRDQDFAVDSPSLLGHEGTPSQTLCECFGVNAKSRPDPDGGYNAGIDVAIDARFA